MHDVFISFSFEDGETAEYIVNQLQSKYGISCWICTRNIVGGKRYKKLITGAIKEAKVVVFLQSENAVESKEIPKEIGIAVDADKTIIPFRLDQAQLTGEMEYDLHGVEYIDATIPTMEQRIHDLAKSISKAINKPLLTDSESMASKSPLRSSKIKCSEIFAGRDKLLEDIHTSFEDRNVVFLHGMGGIGKSELARQYWKKNKDYYNTVVFARYDKKLSSLIADDTVFRIDGVNRRTGKNNTQQTDEEYAWDKLKIINKTSDDHTLIIIDNFDVSTKADDFFEKAISDINCRVLVTTRHKPDSKLYHSIPVGEIDDKTLRKLFIQYANPDKTIIEEDNPDFIELFQLTSRHTYTLELLAKFMEENSNIDYISEMIDFLKKHGFGDVEVGEYNNIYKLFRFTSLDDNEKYFLRCLSIMPPAGISQRLFKKWIDSGFSSRSHLVDLSLVKIDGETKTIALHPIVREVVLNELKPSYDNCKAFIDKCVMLGEDRIPLMWSLSYDEKKLYLNCYLSILSVIGDVTAELFPVYANISIMYNFAGNYTQAIEFNEDLYNFACKQYGKNSEQAMLILNRIGWKSSNCMLYNKALPYFKTAADWVLSNPALLSREALSAIQNCGDCYTYLFKQTHDTAYLDKAHEYLDKCRDTGNLMLERLSESDPAKLHLKYQTDCIVRLYHKLSFGEKKYDLSEAFLNKYKEIVLEFENATQTPNVDRAYYHTHYAKLLMIRNDPSTAREHLKQAAEIYLRFFGNSNTRILDVYEQLIIACIKLNDLTEAKSYLSKSSEIATRLFTTDHPIFKRLHELECKVYSDK